MRLTWLPLAALFLTSFSLSSQSSYETCKTLPGDPDWPSESEWSSLNSTVEGQLIHYIPTGAVCSQSSGHYDKVACEALLPVYWRQAFVVKDPGLVRCLEFTNNSCDPTSDPSTPCTQGYYPEYVVNATKEAHVSAAINFAKEHNIRLNVKNTGHDFTGRSTARGSLSVWIAHWRKLEWSDEFTTSCNNKKYSAATITGGVQWKEVYGGAAVLNKAFVGGASGTVGALGGYLQGGGHSPLSHTFGMAVDNVLELTVVTLTDGKVVKANECTNPDLFWALRGGGGSTFGIVTSATIKTYPAPSSVVVGRIEINITDSSADITAWKNANAFFHSQLGNLADAGISGYYQTLSILHMHFDFSLLNKTAEELDVVVSPLMTKLNGLAHAEGSNFVANYIRMALPWSLYAMAYTTDRELNIGFGAPTAGNRDTVLGSRLIPRSVMEHDPAAYMEVYMSVLNGSTANLGHLVAGGQVAKNKHLDVALNPAWRQALSHIVLHHEVNDDSGDEVRQQARAGMTVRVAKLKSITPGSGAYMNECDLNEPDKANAFFGVNYPRLYKLKQRYDPYGLLWCNNCVGYDDWEEVNGRLCQASGYCD